MAGYNYETVSNDPKKREEILTFLSGLEQSMDTLKIETEKKPRFLEAIDDLRTTLDGKTITYEVTINDDKDTISYPCDFNRMVDYMRGRMVHLHRYCPEAFRQVMETVPNAQAFLEGVGMPEPGTAGYLFDTYSDDQVYTGGYKVGHKKELTDMTDCTVVAGAQAVMYATGGVENWRDVKVDENEVIALQQNLQIDMDGLSGFMGAVMKNPEYGGVNAAKALFGTDPKELMDEVDKVYFQRIAPSYMKSFREDHPKYLRAFENPQDDTIDSSIRSTVSNTGRLKNDLIRVQLPILIQSALADAEPSKFHRYLDVRKEELKFRPLYEDLVNKQPIKDTLELLAKGPEAVLNTIAPPAKSRIEALQSRLKKERDAAERLRLTAEIIANRELSGAQRGGKGLENRPGPDAVAARTAEIAAEMGKVYENDPRGMEQLTAQALSGHGGKMMEAYNKAAQPAREAAKPVTYLDYINKLDLEKASAQDVARLVAATGLYVTQEKGAQALADPAHIDKIAAAIAGEPAFRELMNDPKTVQNAKMGLGLPIIEQLQRKELLAEKVAREAAEKKAEALRKSDANAIEKNAKNPAAAAEGVGCLDYLRNMENPTAGNLKWIDEQMQAHPEARELARKIVEQRKLSINIPRTDVAGLDGKTQKLLKEQENKLQDLDRRKNPDLYPKQPEAKSKGSEIGGL